jgi:hypothetical protein
LEIKEDLILEVKPMRILNQSENELKNKNISMVKISRESSQVKKETSKRETKMRRKYLELFLECT